jgi:cytochrome c peroxidase
MNWHAYKWVIILLLLSGFVLPKIFHATDEIDYPKTKTELGKRLFFETALSLDSTISCASCHLPGFAFSDTTAFSKGVNGKLGLRNTPSIMNMASRDLMFFDGRAKDLEDQVHFPIEDPNEMNVQYREVIIRLNADPFYSNSFAKLYFSSPNAQNIANAIAEFERSLETSNTVFDDYMSDKPNTMSASAIRGRALFLSDRSKCFDCHFGPDFTGDEFKNIGLYDGVNRKDIGRFKLTGDSADIGRFKVPGLRNVAVTAPYMHDGSFKDLKSVIDYYSNPYDFVKNPINIDSSMRKPILFTEEEKQDLIHFLESLSDRQFISQ